MSNSIYLLFFLMAPTLAQADDWPQYRGIHGDGQSSETIDELDWSGTGPRELWRIDTPTGFSSFAVADGRAFTLVAPPSGDGGQSLESCLAVDAQTGQQLWSVRLGPADYDSGGGNSGAPGNRGGDGPRATPATDGQRVYVYDAHLLLSCFDAKTGELVWQQDIASDYSGRNIGWLNAASPLMDETNIYVPGGGPGESFLAFDKVSGDLLWKSGDEKMTHATPRLATIHGRRQLVFLTQFGLVSVDANSGAEYWRTMVPYRTSSAASPIVADNLVYASAAYGVGAGLFRVTASGQQFEVDNVWFKINKLMNHWSTPVYQDGYLYGIYGHKKYGDAPLQCIDLVSGEIQWSQPGFGAGNCILVGDKLVVLSDFGQLTVVRATPEGYQEVATTKALDGKCWSTPAFSNGRIYIRSTTEGACFDVGQTP